MVLLKRHSQSFMKWAVSRGLISFLVFGMALLNTGCLKHINRNMTHYEAKTSYKSGDYARSFRLTEALAYKGEPQAIYALGYMYYYGLGAPMNKPLGLAWIEEAARKDYKPAVLAIEKITEYKNQLG